MRNPWFIVIVWALPSAVVNAFAVTGNAKSPSVGVKTTTTTTTLKGISPLHLTKQPERTVALLLLSRRKRIQSFLGRPFQSLAVARSPRSSNSNKLRIGALFLATLLVRPVTAWAGGASFGGSKTASVAPLPRQDLITLSTLWIGLFTVLALLHACEIAITTLYPWKVREMAEEEEKMGNTRGVFRILNQDITRVLTTILVTSTACSIFATTLFTHLVSGVFGVRGEKWGAIGLTALTLFFVELLPKSFGVTNAETVARLMVPPVNVVSTIVSPLGISLTWLSKKTLAAFGVKSRDYGAGVSDSQLRLIVTGALDSGTIDHDEQEMISGVLNLQKQRVREIMRPRVEMIAVPYDMSVVNVLGVIRESGYSRIPVYDGEIDNIVGIVMAKDVLDFFVNGVLVDEETSDTISKQLLERTELKTKIMATAVGGGTREVELLNDTAGEPVEDDRQEVEEEEPDHSRYLARIRQGNFESYVRTLTPQELASRMEKSIKEADLIESCYFVPETANGWSVLQEMRRRRVHLAIVVDEYGGTEGLVSLEDIVEEVVGEIYDEDDEDDYEFSEDSITLQADGSFMIRGDADLEDVDTILDLKLQEDESLRDFSTLSGFLCMCAGEIPAIGDFLMIRGWNFEIIKADDKRILQVRVDRLIGALDTEEDGQRDANVLSAIMKRTKSSTSTSSDGNDAMEQSDIVDVNRFAATMVAENAAEADEVERMVDSGGRKKELLEEAIKMRDADSDSDH